MNAIDGLINSIEKLKKEIERLKMRSYPEWIYLTTPLTSASWDGDSFSTTAKTLIDLNAVFGVPAGVKAIYLKVAAKDSGSAGAGFNTCYISLSPSNTTYLDLYIAGFPNDINHEAQMIVPCDANGDIYYSIDATGASTFDVWMEIWGYYI